MPPYIWTDGLYKCQLPLSSSSISAENMENLSGLIRGQVCTLKMPLSWLPFAYNGLQPELQSQLSDIESPTSISDQSLCWPPADNKEEVLSPKTVRSTAQYPNHQRPRRPALIPLLHSGTYAEILEIVRQRTGTLPLAPPDPQTLRQTIEDNRLVDTISETRSSVSQPDECTETTDTQTDIAYVHTPENSTGRSSSISLSNVDDVPSYGQLRRLPRRTADQDISCGGI